MSWKEYEYTSRYHIKSKTILYRPIIEIEVSTENESDSFTALIDSGSEVTIMSGEIAILLGINSRDKKWGTVSGFGAKQGFIDKVNIVVPEFPSTVLTTNVVFVDGVSSDFPFDILLGQDDFFRRFLVKFEKYKDRFYLSVAP